MTAWVYRPNHPEANSNGMVPRSIADNYVRSSAPYVISDTMTPTKHMATGQTLDSKSKFRQATKASGCVEIGNEAIKPRAPVRLDKGERREAIQRAVYQLRNR